MTELPPPPFDPAAALAAADRFRDAAAAEVDVAYAVADTPIGPLVLAATPRGLVQVSFTDEPADVDRALERLADRLSPRILEVPRRLDAVRRELDEYFAGSRTHFDVALDWTLVGDFAGRILRATAEVPFGRTATYGEVAAQAGSPKGARAAGRALNGNPIPVVVPCHRIVGASGALVGYAGGLERKITLLRTEGLVL